MTNEERCWKIHDDSRDKIKELTQSQANEIEKMDKWLMAISAGSFGLSFAFIDSIVSINNAAGIRFLVAAWSCFLIILVIGVLGNLVSAIRNSVMIQEEFKALPLKYDGKEPEYKKRSVFFNANAVFAYAQILLFTGGALCLILFLAKNLI